MKKSIYTLVKHNDDLILVMNKRIAKLVISALEIINPDDDTNEILARNLARYMENIL